MTPQNSGSMQEFLKAGLGELAGELIGEITGGAITDYDIDAFKQAQSKTDIAKIALTRLAGKGTALATGGLVIAEDIENYQRTRSIKQALLKKNLLIPAAMAAAVACPVLAIPAGIAVKHLPALTPEGIANKVDQFRQSQGSLKDRFANLLKRPAGPEDTGPEDTEPIDLSDLTISPDEESDIARDLAQERRAAQQKKQAEPGQNELTYQARQSRDIMGANDPSKKRTASDEEINKAKEDYRKAAQAAGMSDEKIDKNLADFESDYQAGQADESQDEEGEGEGEGGGKEDDKEKDDLPEDGLTPEEQSKAAGKMSEREPGKEEDDEGGEEGKDKEGEEEGKDKDDEKGKEGEGGGEEGDKEKDDLPEDGLTPEEQSKAAGKMSERQPGKDESEEDDKGKDEDKKKKDEDKDKKGDEKDESEPGFTKKLAQAKKLLKDKKQQLSPKALAKKAVKKLQMKTQQATGKALRWSITSIPATYGASLIYTLFHFCVTYLGGLGFVGIFCRFGHEWTIELKAKVSSAAAAPEMKGAKKAAKKLGGTDENPLAGIEMVAEILEICALIVVVALISVIIIIIIAIIYFLFHPLDLLKLLI